MGERIVFVDGDRIGVISEAGTRYFVSDFCTKYRQNIRSIRERNTWKNEGSGAAFRNEPKASDLSLDEGSVRVSINGLVFLPEGGRVVYSTSSNDSSGIYIKALSDEVVPEGHVIHHARMDFSSLDYSAARGELAVSVCAGDREKHIAVLALEGGTPRTVTAGESVDESPSWSRTDRAKVYYSSFGIGRDMQGNFMGCGPSAIFCLDLDARSAEEVLSFDRFDCLLPRQDRRGNLYFIRKPYAEHKDSMTFLDVLSVPYKLGQGVFRYLEFFTQAFTGQSFRSGGANPAKSRTEDRRQIMINGNLINVEKTLKENSTRGEKYPGIAPSAWQLMRRAPDGTVDTVRRGVLAYDLTSDGGFVCSNGKFIIHVGPDGAERRAEKHDLVTKIRVFAGEAE